MSYILKRAHNTVTTTTTTVLRPYRSALPDAHPVKNCRILLVQSFTARVPLLTASGAFGLGRRLGSSPQQRYLHWLRTLMRNTVTHTPSTHPFNGPLSGTTQMSRYQKGKTNLDFTEARDSEWQWPRLGHMQVCTSLQTDNHASTPPLSAMHNTVTGKESEDAVAGGIHVEALAGVRTVDACAGNLLTAVTVVRAQMRVGEVAALVVVVTHAQFLQLREVDVQRTAAVVHVLAVQRL